MGERLAVELIHGLEPPDPRAGGEPKRLADVRRRLHEIAAEDVIPEPAVEREDVLDRAGQGDRLQCLFRPADEGAPPAVPVDQPAVAQLVEGPPYGDATHTVLRTEAVLGRQHRPGP